MIIYLLNVFFHFYVLLHSLKNTDRVTISSFSVSFFVLNFEVKFNFNFFVANCVFLFSRRLLLIHQIRVLVVCSWLFTGFSVLLVWFCPLQFQCSRGVVLFPSFSVLVVWFCSLGLVHMFSLCGRLFIGFHLLLQR